MGRDAATTAAEEAHVHVLAAANLELGAVRALANFHKLGIATASLRCRGGVCHVVSAEKVMERGGGEGFVLKVGVCSQIRCSVFCPSSWPS